MILRIVLPDGTEGIAESVCRPGHTGEDAVTVAYQLDTFFKPLLIGADPLGHLALLAKIAKVSECRAAKMLIDVALWDLRGKVFGQPVWRLLGGTDPKPVPLTWIAHGNTREAMVDGGQAHGGGARLSRHEAQDLEALDGGHRAWSPRCASCCPRR